MTQCALHGHLCVSDRGVLLSRGVETSHIRLRWAGPSPRSEYIGNNLAGRDIRRPLCHDPVIIRFYQWMRSHDTPPHYNNGK